MTGHVGYDMLSSAYKECVRDKPVDRTATCPQGKVLKLADGLK